MPTTVSVYVDAKTYTGCRASKFATRTVRYCATKTISTLSEKARWHDQPVRSRAGSADRKPHFENAVFRPHKTAYRTILKIKPHPKKPHKTAHRIKPHNRTQKKLEKNRIKPHTARKKIWRKPQFWNNINHKAIGALWCHQEVYFQEVYFFKTGSFVVLFIKVYASANFAIFVTV